MPIKYCADAAGIHRKTIYDWMKKGKEAKSGKYHQFFLDMQKARSKFISFHLQKIASNKSWMASQYLLQVTDPEVYVVAEKKEIEADVKADVEQKVDVKTIFDIVDEELGL